jgi:hypothetical protein
MKAILYKLRQPDGKEGWVLCDNNMIRRVLAEQVPHYQDPNGYCYKILTQSPILSSLSPDEQKEIGWFDVDKIALDIWDKHDIKFRDMCEFSDYCVGFTDGFKKALELSGRFTEKDMLSLIDEIGLVKTTAKELNSKDYQPFVTDEDGQTWTINKEHLIKHIQSLPQPKSWEVEYEEVGGVYKVVEIIKPQLLQ